MTTIDDLVRVSGYSRSTVFRFLAGKNVRKEAREAIRVAAREIGFTKGVKQDRDDVAILLSVPSDFEGFRGFADAVEGIMRRAGELGLPLVFDESHAAGKRLAVVCLGKNKSDEDAEFSRRKELGQAMVFVNRMPDDQDASWVSVDFRIAAAEAGARLVAAGCGKIAVWADAEDRRVETEKLRGLRECLRTGNGRIELIELSPEQGTIEEAARAVLSEANRPDGWFGVSDEIAMRVIRIASSLGLRVPRDLSVIGMNDVEGAAYFTPALTSVHVPFRECGIAAVDIALRLLDNPSEHSVKLLMRHRLIERESCAAANDLSL
ncbi:MAG: LacI family DNA-binding transcriptional regulator [Treponemataceae bacterium]